MGAKLGAEGGPMADINVTPLIDVVLVLLVVFMVVTPMLQSGLPVELPIATQSTTVNDVGQHITISITTDRGWWVEQEEVTAETLVDQVNYEYRVNPERSILVKADRNLEYGKVREALDILAEARLTSVFVATNKEG
jgi:biopolymer transport protein ExbD